MGQQAEQYRKDRKSNRVRQKNKRGDSKVESNDSPEIPDRGGDIQHSRPLFRGTFMGRAQKPDKMKQNGVSRAAAHTLHRPHSNYKATRFCGIAPVCELKGTPYNAVWL